MSKSEAARNGWFAHRNGIRVEFNPYDERSQNISHNDWITGWCDRFAALKHDRYDEYAPEYEV